MRQRFHRSDYSATHPPSLSNTPLQQLLVLLGQVLAIIHPESPASSSMTSDRMSSSTLSMTNGSVQSVPAESQDDVTEWADIAKRICEWRDTYDSVNDVFLIDDNLYPSSNSIPVMGCVPVKVDANALAKVLGRLPSVVHESIKNVLFICAHRDLQSFVPNFGKNFECAEHEYKLYDILTEYVPPRRALENSNVQDDEGNYRTSSISIHVDSWPVVIYDVAVSESIGELHSRIPQWFRIPSVDLVVCVHVQEDGNIVSGPPPLANTPVLLKQDFQELATTLPNKRLQWFIQDADRCFVGRISVVITLYHLAKGDFDNTGIVRDYIRHSDSLDPTADAGIEAINSILSEQCNHLRGRLGLGPGLNLSIDAEELLKTINALQIDAAYERYQKWAVASQCVDPLPVHNPIVVPYV